MKNCVTKSGDTEFLIDKEDYPLVSKYGWMLHSGGYIYGYIPSTKKLVYLHRFLKDAPKGKMVDHINRNKLDNRKSNLRLVTRSQNMYNSIGKKKRRSKYKGVYFSENRKKWIAQINVSKNKMKYLGGYTAQEEAALAYNNAAKSICGEYVLLNKIIR